MSYKQSTSAIIQTSKKQSFSKIGLVLKTTSCALPVLLYNIDAFAAFDLEAGIKAATDPIKNVINTYYPVAIFITGAIGALMQNQGDLRDRMMGFGKGALVGGLTVLGVKAGLGV